MRQIPDVIAASATRFKISQRVSRLVVMASIKYIGDCLRQHESVNLQGFGKFIPVDRGPKKGRNPITGEPMDIPPSRTVRFVPSKGLLGEQQEKD